MSLTKIISLTDKAFKGGLRYVAAINQSRAKWVLDPVYEFIAGRLLDKVPLSPALLAKKYDDNLFFKYQQASRRLSWSIEDWDFSKARPELLTPRQAKLVHSFATGETSGFAVGAGFLNAFRNSPELGAFFGVWFTEELNHYFGYHRYLERMGQGWSKERKEDVTGVEFLPYSKNPMEVAAANMYQELIGYLVYRSFARQCRDPFLAKLVTKFSKDELRHYKFYQAVVARQIQREPKFRILVLKHFFKATTPLNQVSGGPGRVVEHLTGASFYFRKPEYDFMLRQTRFLFGHDFEKLFRYFYSNHLPPCAFCHKEVFLCECEFFEELPPPSGKTAPKPANANSEISRC